MTIREAALHLGVSDLTVRRRIKDGRLAHRLENGKYLINLDPPMATADSDLSNSATAPQPDQLHDQVDRADQSAKPAAYTTSASVKSRALDQPGDTDQSSRGADHHAPRFDLNALLAEHRKLAEIAGRAQALEHQLQVLEQRHAALQEGVVSLSNRNGWLESKLQERESQIKLLTDSRPRRPWWKRMFGAEVSS